MVISSRQASRILEATAGIGRQQSRRALLSGLAGPGERTAGTVLYDEAAVRDLARWRVLEHETLLHACPDGVLVVRLGRGEEPAPGDSWATRAAAFRRQPYLGLAAWLQVRAFVAVHHRLACVFTVCGYPVLTADLVSFDAVSLDAAGDQVELGLEPPGGWSGLLHQHRLVTSPGPRWLVLGAQPYLGRAERARDRGEPVDAGRSTTWSRWA
jgi:hypothetical protein